MAWLLSTLGIPISDTCAMFGAIAMTTLTIRLPDDTAARLKSLARSRGLSTNRN